MVSSLARSKSNILLPVWNVDFFFSNSRNDFDKITYPLNLAAKLGHKPIVTILLANGAELNRQDHFSEYPKGKQGSTPLIEATKGGFIEIMQQLISKGADINKVDELSEKWDLTALIAASAKRNLNAVKLLVENGADLNIGRIRKCEVDILDKGTALDFAIDLPSFPIEDEDYPNADTTPTYDYLQEKGALPSSLPDCGPVYGPR